jgi:hypothetical protein
MTEVLMSHWRKLPSSKVTIGLWVRKTLPCRLGIGRERRETETGRGMEGGEKGAQEEEAKDLRGGGGRWSAVFVRL